MIEVENGSMNVYEDLRFSNASEMHSKAILAAKIDGVTERSHLTESQVAEIIGMPLSKLSCILRGEFRGIGEADLLECLDRLSRHEQMLETKASEQ
jgi:predicted XRE-type DNA-binding protein